MPLTRSGEHERRVGEAEDQAVAGDWRHTATSPPPADIVSLMKWMEETRLRDEERRREAEESRRQEDNARFEALISMLAAQRQTPQVPPEDDGEDPENPTRRQPQQPRTPSTQKPAAQIPPPLKPDATYQLLRRRAEEIDICPGKSSVCEETQLKSVILMGVRDDELIQRLISLEDKCSLQEMVTACRSYEAARCATSDIRAQPTQVRALTQHQKSKKQKNLDKQPPQQSTAKTAELCQCCARYHETGACPAAQVTCRNCGRQGHFASTVKCPASKAQCRLCSRIGHFDSCCKKVSRQNHKRGSTDGAPTPSQQKSKQLSCRRVISPSPAVPQHVSVLVTHGDYTLCAESTASLHTVATVRAVTGTKVDDDRILEELRHAADFSSSSETCTPVRRRIIPPLYFSSPVLLYGLRTYKQHLLSFLHLL
ncbi:hypothetical protein O3P69_004665 [Scylla paramamosain]|uniref:Gag-like protein n=1 Tax=Scylla paramamosain TaxID=85552 RepID=A0AAW0UAL5_SCYPA